ncbi:RSP_2647 family RNA methyltransferase [Halocynthiibacter namhaensis]|uniref:RSP_2647 family RNA methyltransferase n=1 Tax=Halocynthiibacter namhaensis TaxID=1290553 RepID=UPI0005794502|nr:class I SAM-dependent rRNA methyltransferase [Halocynthiibacter namhaensis]
MTSSSFSVTDPADRPVIRMKPKMDTRRIRFGAPWVWANELVLDRRSKNLAPGTIATLEDAERTPLGTVAVNTGSKIAARMLDRNAETRIDAAWFVTRVQRALALRENIYDAPFYRLIHAEADGFPGVVADRFGDTIVVQPNAAWAEMHFDMLKDALAAIDGVKNIVKNAAGRARATEGLDDVSGVVLGEVTGLIPVEMNSATYMADLLGGQKTGLFFDQRDNHAFGARVSKDATVLDVFSHVGGFGLAALAAGAKSATCIDGSAPALELAEKGAAAMNASDRLVTRKGDAFDVMEEMVADGVKFDVVICDPPAFAPSKPALEKGLRAYERVARLAAQLVAPGGYMGLCSCSHSADATRFREACDRGVGKAGRQAQLLHTGSAGPDHPQHPSLAESGYLKAMFWRLDG